MSGNPIDEKSENQWYYVFVLLGRGALGLVPCREMLDPCELVWDITPCPGLWGRRQAKGMMGDSGPPFPTVESLLLSFPLPLGGQKKQTKNPLSLERTTSK